MTQSIKGRTAAIDPVSQAQELRLLFESLLADVTALRATVAALVTDVGTIDTAFDTLATKLNADTGVNDTNYASSGTLTASAPAALNTVE